MDSRKNGQKDKLKLNPTLEVILNGQISLSQSARKYYGISVDKQGNYLIVQYRTNSGGNAGILLVFGLFFLAVAIVCFISIPEYPGGPAKPHMVAFLISSLLSLYLLLKLFN